MQINDLEIAGKLRVYLQNIINDNEGKWMLFGTVSKLAVREASLNRRVHKANNIEMTNCWFDREIL